VLHADFDVSSSRKDVDHDSPRNEQFRSLVPEAFVSLYMELVTEWTTLSDYSLAAEKATIVMKYVPLEGDLTGFFEPVAAMIAAAMRNVACILTSDGSWELPSNVISYSNSRQADIPSDCIELKRIHQDMGLSNKLKRALGIRTLKHRKPTKNNAARVMNDTVFQPSIPLNHDNLRNLVRPTYRFQDTIGVMFNSFFEFLSLRGVKFPKKATFDVLLHDRECIYIQQQQCPHPVRRVFHIELVHNKYMIYITNPAHAMLGDIFMELSMHAATPVCHHRAIQDYYNTINPSIVDHESVTTQLKHDQLLPDDIESSLMPSIDVMNASDVPIQNDVILESTRVDRKRQLPSDDMPESQSKRRHTSKGTIYR